jgi:predicted ester cyclase
VTGTDPATIVRDMIRAIWADDDADAVDRYFVTALHAAIEEHRAEMRAGFSGFRVDVAQTVSDGDTVFARLVLSGDQTGPFAGVEPTGRTVTWDSARVYRIEDGKIAEAWGLQDRLGLLQQLGVVDGSLG